MDKATKLRKLQRAHMFFEDEHICSNELDEKVQRAQMFLGKTSDEKAQCAHMFLFQSGWLNYRIKGVMKMIYGYTCI